MGKLRMYSGKMIDPLALRPCDISIEDIAHNLSNICRFNGACRRHYSVAQHSLLVAECVPAQLKIQALLHDASEAYLGDVSTFLKHSNEMYEYRQLESRVERTILETFGIDLDIPKTRLDRQLIKAADILVYDLEKHELFNGELTEDDVHPKMLWAMERMELPAGLSITPYRPEDAEAAFLNAWNRYRFQAYMFDSKPEAVNA